MDKMTTSIISKSYLLALALAIPSAQSLHAANAYWDGGANNHLFLDAVNWQGDVLPTTGSGTAGDVLFFDLADNYATYSETDGTNSYRTIRIGYGSNGRLDITGGTFTASDTVEVRIGLNGHSGTLNLSGGTFNAGGLVQIGLSDNSNGYVYQTGGTFNGIRGATADGISNVSVSVGTNSNTGGESLYQISDGTLATRFGLLLGHSTATTSTATFKVIGGASTIQIGHYNAADSGFWVQRANGTLDLTIDSADNFALSTIGIYDSGSGDSFLTFDAGTTINVSFSGDAPSETKTWNVFEYDSDATVTDNGIVITGYDTPNWSYAFVDLGNGTSALQLTYTIPEPASMGLLGGIIVLGCSVYNVVRRRK
jgi:hypothetical protein